MSGPSGGGSPTSGAALQSEGGGAPLRFDYRILGSPIAGQPVAVELTIETPLVDRPINVSYRAADPGSFEFPESQAREIEVVPTGSDTLRPVQVTVVPARDGRIYLAVTATVETDTGSVRKAISVPIMVRAAPLDESEDDTA